MHSKWIPSAAQEKHCLLPVKPTLLAGSVHPPVLVLGGGITGLGALRVFGRAGIPCLATPEDPLLRASRWFRPGPTPFPAQHENLSEWLVGSGLDRAVLFPCSDHWLKRVGSLDVEVRRRFPASVPNPATIDCLTDKGVFLTRLQELGIAHPWTHVLESPDDLEHLPDDILSRSFLKPRDSQRFFAEFGVKAFRVENRQDAFRRLTVLGPHAQGLLVQEYVPGPATNHFFIDGFIDRNGEVRALFARRRLRMFPLDFGNSTYMKSIALDDIRPARDAITRLLRSISHRGIFSAEFKRDERDGAFRLLEVNARAWWYVDFASRCGVDVCSMAYADALERPLESVTSYVQGRRAMYPYYDIYAVRALRRLRRSPSRLWLLELLGAHQPVFTWSDPVPSVTELLRMAWATMRRRLRDRVAQISFRP
jgi:D-aspartate ligase